MAGTDTQHIGADHQGPVIILVDPQMPENIGACARAMLNCGLVNLRLVRPREGWPHEKAEANAAGALPHMPPVRVFETTAEACADLSTIYATTARPRDLVKPVFTPDGAMADAHTRTQAHEKIGILFGGERAGLTTEDVARADAIITIPLNPGFSSLNLGQAVLLLAYEWRKLQVQHLPTHALPTGKSEKASAAVRTELYARLEAELAERGFFRTPEMRPAVVRNIVTMLNRADLTDQEVQTLHGIITVLTTSRKA